VQHLPLSLAPDEYQRLRERSAYIRAVGQRSFGVALRHQECAVLRDHGHQLSPEGIVYLGHVDETSLHTLLRVIARQKQRTALCNGTAFAGQDETEHPIDISRFGSAGHLGVDF